MTIAQLTNEESRIAIYAHGETPTIASKVTADTPIEDLNLNWTEKELPERERTKHVHRLHPYLGKFIPQLVEIFLRKYFQPGDIVLDPFCGSGTTLVQANELGIESIGFDISAFNVLLSKVKTASYDLSTMRKEALNILDIVSNTNINGDPQLALWQDQPNMDGIARDSSEYLKEWFAPKALNTLLFYREEITRGNYQYQDLLRIILSRTARSARLTTHFDLDFPKQPQREPYWCYKHSRECQPTTDALKFFKRYTLDTIKRIECASALLTDAAVSVYHADSRSIILPQINGIITSPPYVGLIDYHDQHKYAYHLLGLEDRSGFEIGSAINGSSKKSQRQYQQDIAEVFRRSAMNMPSGSRMIVVAGDKSNLYPEIAVLAGVEVEAILKRHVNRRTGRRSSEFYESIFIWRKP